MGTKVKSPYSKTKQYKGGSSYSNNKPKKNTAAFLCRLFGIIMLFGVIACLLPATLPRIGGYEPYRVVSDSMEPEIPVGSLAYIKVKAPADIHVNDVIAYFSDQTINLQRVVENDSSNREITLKNKTGSNDEISRVSYDNVIGIVASHMPRLGSFISKCLGIPGRFIILAIAVIGTVLIFISGRFTKT